LPLAGTAGLGAFGAYAVGAVGAAFGPVSSARVVEPGRHVGVATTLGVLVLGAAVLAMLLGIVAVVQFGTRAPSHHGLLSGLARNLNPVRALGVRAALTSRGSFALLAAAVAAIAAVSASLVFGASLDRFVGDGARFGWPFSGAVITEYGYNGADHDTVAKTLDRREVRAWGIAAMPQGMLVDGHPVAMVAARDGFEQFDMPVAHGRLPRRAGEIALGARTARSLHVRVGDDVRVSGAYGSGSAKVVGIVVLPAIGALQSDRVSLGTGALLSKSGFDAFTQPAEKQAGLEPGTIGDQLGAFVAYDLAPGIDRHRFSAAIAADTKRWDPNSLQIRKADPVRPSLVADVANMRGIPFALGGVFALAMTLALVLGIASATRDRGRELALLRALGCRGRDLRASIRAHALAIVTVGVVLGAPLGAFLGREGYRAFAHDIGVVPSIALPAVAMGTLVAGAIVVGLAVAQALSRSNRRRILPDGDFGTASRNVT
jgi:hypothetical protein